MVTAVVQSEIWPLERLVSQITSFVVPSPFPEDRKKERALEESALKFGPLVTLTSTPAFS
jgi:hypothetical protein